MKYKPLFIHIILSGALVCLFFGKLMPNLNHIYFSRSGDGFRTYFGIYYHAKYDPTSYRLDGMNYPFGETIDFTDCQPPVANTIRFISNNITDITGYTTGIVNGLMLLSFFLASIFLFLILRRMKLPAWYASTVALCMVFLSPQTQRIGGHFSLGWMFWVPLSIYLLMVFNEKRAYLFSALICLFATLAGAMHFYFLAFWLFLFGLYWVYRWIWRGNYTFQKNDLLHFFIQVLLPVIILQLNLIINDPVTDRTSNPWGFYAYRGHFPTVFFPLAKYYFPFSDKLSFGQNYEWEAYCYIGIVASTGAFILFFKWFISFIRKREAVSITGDNFDDFLFWGSLIVLLFSFGIPFIMLPDKVRQLSGPLGQLRGVARFGWLFYYAINIIVFKKIYFALWTEKGKKWWKKTFVFLFLAVFVFEAWTFSWKYQDLLNNTIAELDESNNESLSTFCKTNITASDYQAVLPLPYFHIGSESIWIEQECDIMKQSFIVSMKTGLPNIGMMAARTSISQTYENVALARTPWEKYDVTEKFKNNKALLLTVANCEKLNPDEKRLVENAIWIGECQNLKFYKLPLETLKSIPAKYNYPAKYEAMVDSTMSYMPDSLAFIAQDNNRQKEVQLTSEFQNILESPLKLDMGKPVFIRFWVQDFNQDLVARTYLLVIQAKPDHQTIEEKYSDIFRHIRAINGNWALIEIELHPQQEQQIFKLLLKSRDLKGKILHVKDLSVSQLEI